MATTIVLADDDDDIRTLYATLLRADGHQVWDTAKGEDVLSLIRDHRPRLLLLDVWMPGMNGFEVLEQMRHDPASATVRVVMLSNMSDADTRMECFEMGAADYLIKGLPLDEFRDRVGRILEAGPLS